MSKYVKRLMTILLLIVLVSITTLDVFAGSVTLSINGADTVKVGDNITLTVSASDINGLTDGLATAQGDMEFDESYLEYIAFKAVSSSLSVSYGTKTKRFVALGIGGEYISSNDDLFTLTFKAKRVGETVVNIKGGSVVIGDTKAIIHSSNVRSKTIKIVDANDNTQTNPPNTEPSKKPSTSGGSSSGDKKPNGNNSGNSNSKKSSDNTLESLIINNAKTSPSFNKNTTTYNVVVPKDVSKLDLSYVTSDKKASVSISGNDKLKDDEVNVVIITVTAENGDVRKYTLNVTKSDDKSSNKLASLDIKEKPVEFNKNTYEYSIKVPNDIKKLTIDAIPEDKNSKVEIIGNDRLSRGNNVVLIKLTDKNGYSNYYRVNVNRSNKITLFGIEVKYIIIGILILLLILFLIWWFLIFKRKRDNEKEEEVAKKVNVDKPLKVQIINDDKKENEQVDVEDDLYDDIVTKDELITAIEERNPKKLKMLLTQEKANKLKEELKQEEMENTVDNEDK